MPCKFTELEIPGVILVEPKVFNDPRGYFKETYKFSEFKSNGITEAFVQDNHSVSQKNVLRGIHFQRNPKAQGKLVRVGRGAVIDFAVDLRKNSSTFKKWVGIELSADNHKMLYIPAGFGHAFISLEDDTHLLYKCTDEYSTDHDGGIRWDDPDLGIDWGAKKPLISDKDNNLPYLRDIKELF